VSRIRLVSALIIATFGVASLHAGPGLFKKKPDAIRVSTLIETLKSNPDEKKRKAAADELGGADSRFHPEAATALIVALQKDASPSVRAEAAASLGDLGQVFPVAGQALEAAAANDSSALVRLAAKRTLWEYHLSGYRSPKGADGTLTQTIEPPIASPVGPRTTVMFVPAPPLPVVVSAPPTLVPQLPLASVPSISRFGPSLPLSPLTGPRVSHPSIVTEMFSGSQLIDRESVNSPVSLPLARPPILNLTQEPPLAKRPAVTIPPFPEPTNVPPPTITFVPPPLPELTKPDYEPTLPPFMPNLPSVALPPDAEEGPTVEPLKLPPTLRLLPSIGAKLLTPSPGPRQAREVSPQVWRPSPHPHRVLRLVLPPS
jgi:hypothetical protein